MAYTAIVSSKGQVVIPAPLRKRFGLQEERKIVFPHASLTSTPKMAKSIRNLTYSYSPHTTKYARLPHGLYWQLPAARFY